MFICLIYLLLLHPHLRYFFHPLILILFKSSFCSSRFFCCKVQFFCVWLLILQIFHTSQFVLQFFTFSVLFLLISWKFQCQRRTTALSVSSTYLLDLTLSFSLYFSLFSTLFPILSCLYSHDNNSSFFSVRVSDLFLVCLSHSFSHYTNSRALRLLTKRTHTHFCHFTLLFLLSQLDNHYNNIITDNKDSMVRSHFTIQKNGSLFFSFCHGPNSILVGFTFAEVSCSHRTPGETQKVSLCWFKYPKICRTEEGKLPKKSSTILSSHDTAHSAL